MDNVTVLRNDFTIISRGNCSIVFAGVDDPYAGRDDLYKALYGVPRNYFIVLIAHSPQIIDKAKGKVGIILSGHTHGGQIVIPFYGPVMVPLPREYRRYVSGLYVIGDTYMYVTRGIGTSIYPIRMFCPPEITLIKLHSSRPSCS